MYDLLYCFAPFLFDKYKKLLPDKQEYIIKFIDILRNSLTLKIEDYNKDICEIELAQTFNKIFF